MLLNTKEKFILSSVLIALALLSMSIALVWCEQSSQWNMVLYLWLTACLLGCLAFVPYRVEALQTYCAKFTWQEGLCFTLVIAVGFYLRFFNLSEIPVSLHNDEMNIGLSAREFFSAEAPALCGVGWFSHPNLGYAIPALFLKLVSNDLFGLRVCSLFFSMLTLVCSYFFVRNLWGQQVALLVLFMLTFYHAHLHYSRSGFHFMHVSGLAALCLFSTSQALKLGKLYLYALAGLLCGVTLQNYSSAYLLAVVMPSWIFALLILNSRQRKSVIRGGIVFAIFTLFCMSPIILDWFNHPEHFQSRSKGVLIFDPSNQGHVAEAVGSNELGAVLLYQARQILRYFIGVADGAVQYGFEGPFLDYCLWLPWLIGLALLFFQASYLSARIFFCMWIIFGFVFGALLTVDSPYSPRLLIISVMLFVPAAICLSRLLSFANLHKLVSVKILAWLVVLVVLVGSALWNLEQYFVIYPKYRGAVARDIVGRLLQNSPRFSLLVNLRKEQEEFGYESYQFMAPKVKAVNLASFAELDQVLGQSSSSKLIMLDSHKGAALFKQLALSQISYRILPSSPKAQELKLLLVEVP